MIIARRSTAAASTPKGASLALRAKAAVPGGRWRIETDFARLP